MSLNLIPREPQASAVIASTLLLSPILLGITILISEQVPLPVT